GAVLTAPPSSGLATATVVAAASGSCPRQPSGRRARRQAAGRSGRIGRGAGAGGPVRPFRQQAWVGSPSVGRDRFSSRTRDEPGRTPSHTLGTPVSVEDRPLQSSYPCVVR